MELPLPLSDLIWASVAAAAATGAVIGVGIGIAAWRGARPGLGGAAVALALVAGYPILFSNWPDPATRTAASFTPWFVFIAGIISLLGAAGRSAATGVSLFAAFNLIAEVARYRDDQLATGRGVGVITGLVATAWGLALEAAERTTRTQIAMMVALSVTCAAISMAGPVSGSLEAMQLFVPLSVAAPLLTIATFFERTRDVARGAAPVLAVAIAAQLVSLHFFSELAWWRAALLMLMPLSAWVIAAPKLPWGLKLRAPIAAIILLGLAAVTLVEPMRTYAEEQQRAIEGLDDYSDLYGDYGADPYGDY